MPGQDFSYALPQTVVPGGCILIVAGDTSEVERFAAEAWRAGRQAATEKPPALLTGVRAGAFSGVRGTGLDLALVLNLDLGC